MKRRFLGLLAVLSLCGAQATASAAALALLPPGAEKPYVGVTLAPTGSGLEVLTVLEGTPAQTAGLESGDVITALDAAPIASIESLNEALSRHAPGDQVELSVQRGDQTISVIVELGAKPAATELETGFLTELPEPEVFLAEPPQEAPRGGGYLGIFVEPTDGGGAKIAGVRPGSPAEQGRLKEGDTILAIDGKKVESADQLKEILAARAAGDEIQVTILRDGGEKQRIVKLARFEDLDWSEALAAAPAPAAEAPEGQEKQDKPLVLRAVKKPKVRVAVPAEPAVAEKQAEGAKRGWLGIYYGEDEQGVKVDDTVAEGPAEKAGVQAGDVILYLDEAKIDSSADLLKVLEGTRKGKTVAMMVLREGKPLEFDVKLGKQPAEAKVAAEDFVEVAPAPRARVAQAAPERKPRKAKKAESFTLAPERSIRLVPGPGGGFMLKVDGQGEGLEIPAHGSKVLMLEADGENAVKVRILDPGERDFAVVVEEKGKGMPKAFSTFGQFEEMEIPFGIVEQRKGKKARAKAPAKVPGAPCCASCGGPCFTGPIHIENAYFYFGGGGAPGAAKKGPAMPPHAMILELMEGKDGTPPHVFMLGADGAGDCGSGCAPEACPEADTD